MLDMFCKTAPTTKGLKANLKKMNSILVSVIVLCQEYSVNSFKCPQWWSKYTLFFPLFLSLFALLKNFHWTLQKIFTKPYVKLKNTSPIFYKYTHINIIVSSEDIVHIH